MNILIVDDTATSLKLLRAQLEAEGHAVHEARDGVEALELLERQRVDAVISDILMPRMDGFRLCHEIRQGDRLRDLPIIIYTAIYTSPDDKKLALDVGADKYLKKPATVEIITAALREVITMPRAAPRPGAMPEVEMLKEYNERLVSKLEEKTIAFEQANRALKANIAKRMRAERALHESGEQLRLALDAARLGTFDWDVSHNRITWSRWHEEMWGFKPGEFGGTYEAFAQRLHPDDAPSINAEVARCIATREPFIREFRVVWPDDSVHWIASRGEFIFDTNDQPVRMRGAVVDVTDRRQAEEELRASERKLRQVIDGLGPDNFVGLLSVEGIVLEANRPALGAAGLHLEDVVGQPFDQTYWFAYSAEVQAQLRATVARAAAGEPSRQDLQVQVAEGSLIWLDFSIQPVRDEAGRVIFLVPSATVIDERKRAEERLRESETNYRTLLESASDAIWVSDQQGRVLDVNAASSRMFGYTRDELLSMSITDVIAKEELSQVGARMQRLKVGENAHGEWHARRKDGTLFPVEVSATILPDGRLMGILRDGTERKQAEEELRRSEERFRELAESVQEVFWITDPAKNQMLYVSPAYAVVWGRSCASLHADPREWLEAIHPDDRDRVLLAAETKQSLGTYDETYRILRPDGTIRWIHDQGFPVRSAGGEVIRIVGTAADITERRQLEEQLRQSQKMEAIGQLAGGVAHDFNNILAAIMMQADLASSAEGVPAETQEMLGDIKAASERAANLTRQLLAFSRRQVMHSRILDLNEVVTSLTKMLQRILGEDVSLQLNLHSGPLMTLADAGMLDQILLNLVVNARDAMPEGGKLSILTSALNLTEREAALIPEASPGRHVSLSVTDTGAGIAPEHLSHIFEPFFTTKEAGQGTGLGLATVFGIVKQHGGWLRLESEVGRGTTFQIALPAIDRVDEPADEISQKAAPRGGTETILLVEDEPSVRMLTRVVLEKMGYRVHEAADGHAALRVWEQVDGAVDLLLTDLVMPEGVSGWELAAQLRSRKPGLKVIFTSGYSAEIAGRELKLKEGQNFIQKPCPPADLLDTVRRALDS